MITKTQIEELRRRYNKPKTRSHEHFVRLGIWANARSTETLQALAGEGIPIISARCRTALLMRGISL